MLSSWDNVWNKTLQLFFFSSLGFNQSSFSLRKRPQRQGHVISKRDAIRDMEISGDVLHSSGTLLQ